MVIIIIIIIIIVISSSSSSSSSYLSTSESLEAMFNILLKQIDKQINYKVTSEIAISHNLLVELCFFI